MQPLHSLNLPKAEVWIFYEGGHAHIMLPAPGTGGRYRWGCSFENTTGFLRSTVINNDGFWIVETPARRANHCRACERYRATLT